MTDQKKSYDLVIIGAGPAGLTAGLYAARYGLKTLILGHPQASLCAEAHKVCNYPTESEIRGPDLIEKMKKNALDGGAELLPLIVNRIEKQEGQFTVFVDSGEFFSAKAIVLALGTKHRTLNLPDEEKYLGKGISYCFTCDGAFFKGKKVAVIGGSDTAATAALYFAEICPEVHLIYRKDKLRAEQAWIDNLSKKENVRILYNTNVIRVQGGGKLEKIELDNSYQGEKLLAVDGLFIEIGEVPEKALTEPLGIELDEFGFIKVDHSQATNIERIWAAGDITTGSDGFRQIITACAEGAIAAKSAFGYLSSRKGVL